MKVRTIFLISIAAIATACGGGGNDSPKDANVPGDAGEPDAACFTNPQTHNEIINACTDAQKIEITTTPPLLNDDGSLPPLP